MQYTTICTEKRLVDVVLHRIFNSYMRSLRHFLLLLTLITIHMVALAQPVNLVDNPSFENYTFCPNSLGDLNQAYWDKAPFHTGSSDYFNACATVFACDVPTNIFGTATARTGDAYAGGYIGLASSPYREYIFDTLISPLQAGKRYRVSFYWRRGSNAQYAGDDIGFYLSTTVPTGTGTGALGVTPTSQSPSGVYLTNDTSWTEYADTIIAGGGEEYITIGAFDAALPVQAQGGGTIGGAYMYYDDVEVILLEGIDGDSNICLGDSAQVYAFELDNIEWVDSANPTVVIDTTDTIMVSPSQSTTYWCISPFDTFSFTVNVVQPLFNFAQDDTVCVDEISEQILNFPGYSYEWSNGSLDSLFQTPDSGEYWVEASLHGCVSRDTFNVYHFPFPDFDLGPDTTICSYDFIELNPNVVANANAGTNVTYSWIDGSNTPTITVNPQGVYWVDVAYENCEVRDSINVSYHPDVVVDLGNDLDFCYLPSVPLSATAQNASAFQWSTGETGNQIDVTTTGTYYVTATGNGCQAMDSVSYTFYYEPMFNLPETLMYCERDTAEISTGLDPNGLNFLWNVGSTDSVLKVFGGSQGFYWVQVSDSNCSMRDTVYVGMHPPIELELGEDVKACAGDTFEIAPTTSNNTTYNYDWNTGQTTETISVQSTGTYSVTVSDAFCQERDKIRVIFFEYPQFSLGNDTILCAPAELRFDVTNEWLNVDYRWYDGQSDPVHIMYAEENQTIWVRQTNEVCTRTDSLKIDIVTPPFVRVPNDTILCDGRPAVVRPEVDREVTYLWSDGSTERALRTTRAGQYHVIVDDGICTSSDTIQIREAQVPDLDIDAPEYICIGEQAILDATSLNAYFYRWQDGSTAPTLSIYEPGIYSVDVTHACGISKDTVIVKDCECFVRFPNAFKPTPSGVNQTFGPSHSCEFLQYEFTIFNRWGEVIFQTFDPNAAWDGTYRGESVGVGAYGYRCVYQALYDGEVVQREAVGTVNLLK